MLENSGMAFEHPRCCIRFIKCERKMCDAQTLSSRYRYRDIDIYMEIEGEGERKRLVPKVKS